MDGWIGAIGGVMIAHGGALALGGLGLVGTTPGVLSEGLPVVILWLLLGLSWIVVGAAQLACGLGVMNKRLRVAALIALAAGFVVTLPLCCVPTLVTTLLGFVVLTNTEVVAAFAEPS